MQSSFTSRDHHIITGIFYVYGIWVHTLQISHAIVSSEVVNTVVQNPTDCSIQS